MIHTKEAIHILQHNIILKENRKKSEVNDRSYLGYVTYYT